MKKRHRGGRFVLSFREIGTETRSQKRAGMTDGWMNSFAVACVALATTGGCQSATDEKAKAREDFRESWAHRTPPGVTDHPKSVLVAKGPSPLVFQMLEPGMVHIFDTTIGQEIASAPVGRGALVYVSEQSGAFASNNRLVAGPFAPGHQYGISVDVSQDESWNSRTQTPPPPRLLPATRPQTN